MENNRLELTWVGKENVEKVEPRILIEDEDKSYGDINTNNMLIHGDNLIALKSLEKDFSGKIKCIYIDPPYNTGSAFENYDDNLEHSIWLNLMKRRLEILKELLSNDGLIFVQIDDNEQAYLKVLMDEIFGRNNFINCISIKMSPSSGLKRSHKEKGFIKNKEYILVYSKGNYKIKPLYDEWTKYDNHYSIYFDGKKYDSLLNILKKKFPDYKGLNSSMYLFYDDIVKYIVDNSEYIYRSHDASKWALENVKNGEILFDNNDFEIVKVCNPKKEDEFELLKSKNSKSGYDRLEPLSWNIVDNRIQTLRGDLWLDFEKDMGNVSKEGGVKFSASKKPERLIYDILSCVTEEGDYVLDSFLGSGTTAAVAHKMNRNWIGIELGDHAYTHCKVRLDKVIDGEHNGISKKYNWKGGGGYKFFELAPTLINEDAFGEPIINKEYNPEMLARAVALHEGFNYSPDETIFWKQSIGNENSYLYVTTQFIEEAIIDKIHNLMEENEYLIIACSSFDEALNNKYKNIMIKKIPEMLLNKCRFNVDNYDLPIENKNHGSEDNENE